MESKNPLREIEPSSRRAIRFAPYLILGLLLVIMPPFLGTYLQNLMSKILIFAIYAISLDIIFGYTGLFSFGHAAYLGIGGYTVGVLFARLGVDSLWLAAPAGILAAALTAAIFGVVIPRISGMYFMLVTFAVAQLFVSIAVKWELLSTSRGAEGIFGIAKPNLGIAGFTWNVTYYYYFVLIVFIICYFLLNRITKSPFGCALQGIREDESRMRVLGYNTHLYRYLAYIIGGAFAGISGVLFAYQNGFMVPTAFGALTSALGVLMVVIGGKGTLYGPAIGAAVIILLEFFSSTLTPERWPLILGGAFVISVMYGRAGIGVYLNRLWRKVLYGSIKS